DQADVRIRLGGDSVVLANNGPMAFVGATERTIDNGVRLDFVFEHRGRGARITRSYACYPGSPTVETWTRIEASGSLETTGLVGWQDAMPLGAVRWLGGLRGDFAGTDESGAFYFDERNLEPGERIEIGSDRRSSEDFVPYFVVDGSRDRFFGGIMWSAGWSTSFERRDDTLRVTTYFPNVIPSGTAQQPLEVPHTFFGVTTKSAGEESAAIRTFVINGIRHGRAFRPLVTYNTWFPYGVRIDEDTMVAEIDRATALGAELFV